jgi:polar amino acid transport system substrate-binding protein
MRVARFVRYFLLLAAIAAASARAGDTLVLATNVDKDQSDFGRLVYLIYSEAFRRLDLTLELRTYPALRSSVEAAADKVDGEVLRAYHYAALHPNLVRVEQPVLAVTMVGFALDRAIELNGMDSLAGKNYRIELRAGYPVFKAQLETVLASEKLSVVTESELGFRKLLAGRTDIYIEVDEYAQPLLAAEPFKGRGIRAAGVVATVPLYGYLNKRHAGLAPRLAQALKEMHDTGVIARLRVRARRAAALP